MSRITGSLLRIQDPVERKHALSCLEKLQAQYAQFLKKEIECSSDVGYKLILQSSVHRLETGIP